MKLGFQFVPFPREIWEQSMHLSAAEFTLLGWFLMHVRFGVEQLWFCDQEILGGCERNGTLYPAIALSRNSLKEARDLLVQKKLLRVHEVLGRSRHYSLELSTSDTESVKVRHQKCQPLIEEVSNSDTSSLYREKAEKAEFLLTPPSEGSGNGNTSPKKNGKVADPRHEEFKRMLCNFFRHLHKIEYYWTARDAGQLGKFLKENPNATSYDVHFWLEDYERSKNVNLDLKPYEFLPRLHRYASGPLDEYGKPLKETT